MIDGPNDVPVRAALIVQRWVQTMRDGGLGAASLHDAMADAASVQGAADAAVVVLPALVGADGIAVFRRRHDGTLDMVAHQVPTSLQPLLAAVSGSLIRVPADSDVPAGRVAQQNRVEVRDAADGARVETYPLRFDGRVVGALCLLYRSGQGPDREAPVEPLIAEAAEGLGTAVERGQASDLADGLWRARSPRSVPRVPGLDIACCSAKGDRDIGSWCEVVHTGPDTVVVAVGVTGSVDSTGVAPAAARHALSASSAVTDEPGQLADLLSEFVSKQLGLSDDAACCVVRLQAATGALDWAGTGGLAPCVVRDRRRDGGEPMPLTPSPEDRLVAGDLLVVGVQGCSGGSGGSVEAVVEAGRTMIGRSLAEGCGQLAADARWNGGTLLDQALVAVHLQPPRPMLTTISASASVALARSYTRRELEHLGVTSPSVHRDAELVVSELVSNVVRHVGGLFDVRWQRAGDVLRVEVTDRGSPLDLRVPETEVLAESGRGLLIVDSLSSAWGVVHAPDGKMVWAELTMPSSREGDAHA